MFYNTCRYVFRDPDANALAKIQKDPFAGGDEIGSSDVPSNSRGSSGWSDVSFAQCQRDVNHNVMNNNKYEGVMHVGMSPKRACQQETRVY